MKMSYGVRLFIEDVALPLLMMSTGVFLFVGLLLCGGEALQARSCAIYAEETGTPTKYRWFDECYIQTPQGSMPWSEFKARVVTRESGAK